METKAVIAKTGSALGKFGSATAGALAGGFIGSKIPEIAALSKIPGVGAILSKLTPGALLILLAYLGGTRFSNEYAKQAFVGLGISGVLDALRRTGLLAKINGTLNTGVNGLRGLKGMGIVQNYGAYSPEYFLMSNWAQRPLNGPGGDAKAFGLQGPDMLSFGLQGPKEKSFGLQGNMGCMYQ